MNQSRVLPLFIIFNIQIYFLGVQP
jgi:hypothetical protein